MENIQNKLFHGIDIEFFPESITSIKILELILESGKIYTKNDFFKKENDPYNLLYYLSREYNQEDNEVCLALHPNNNQFSIRKDKNCPDRNAFNFWILNNISLIISEKILLNREYKIMGVPGEIRISDSINLEKNVEAIGCRDIIKPVVTNLKISIEQGNYENLIRMNNTADYHYFLAAKDTKKYINDKYKRYNRIKEVLNKCDYNIPIIDPITGEEFAEENDIIIKAEEIVLKSREMIKNFYK